MGKPQVPIDPVADLRVRLAREATGRTRALRPIVRTWWSDHGLAAHPASVGKRVAIALIEQTRVEEKLAGIVVLQDLLGTQLRTSDLPAFARLFAAGHLAEWNVVDSFIMKVLVTLLDRPQGRREAARTLAQWRGGDTVWQRRAGCLAFIKLAPQGDAACPGLVDHVLTMCATIVWSIERHDQTAVGCVLRELSRAEPERVETFFRRHALLMSKECARHAVAKLPAELRADLLAHHKRATSLRHS
jgi:hypothetical protein